METELARGAPRYPPPSTPLPEVPQLSQSLPKPSEGGNWAAMEKRRERRRSRQGSGLGLGLGITGVDGRGSFESACQGGGVSLSGDYE